MATSALSKNLQEAAVTICSEKFGCPSQESLHKFKDHLFLMTTFKVYHMCREYGEGSSKIGGLEGVSFNVWESMGRRDSLEKEKYLANSYTAARVNVCYKLCSFFQCYFRSGTEILTAVCSFPGIISWEGTSYFNEREVHFEWGVHLLWWEGSKKFHGVGGTPIMPQSCVVTGFKRSMNYNMLRKIYKK